MSLRDIANGIDDAAASLGGRPGTPAPLERTDGAPWVWVSAQAMRAGVHPRALAERIAGHPWCAMATARQDGLLELRLSAASVAAALRELAAGAGMPPAPAGELGPLDPSSAWGAAAGLGHARAARVARQAGALGLDAASATDEDVAAGLTDPLEQALVVELLDAPRRLDAQVLASGVVGALAAVAAAYLPWEQSCPAIPTRPGALVQPYHRTRVLISQAGLRVLERGMALLGVSAPERM